MNLSNIFSRRKTPKAPLNILFSSTRQWNPGDEFIFFGIRRLFEEVVADKKINWILYDRNPEVNVDGFADRTHKDYLWGNAFHSGNPGAIDLAMVAGSPEWFDLPLINFYNAVHNQKLPLMMLGLGYIDAPITFTETEISCFHNLARLITVRDEYALRELSAAGVAAQLLPCPALFASHTEKRPAKIERIGFILQTDKTVNQRIPRPFTDACIQAIGTLRQHKSVDVICHYIDEYAEFSQMLPPVRYSYDARDYADILADYDLIISTRLHGAILANSVGKPAVMLNVEDTRCSGAAALFPYIFSMPPDGDRLMEWISSAKADQWRQLPQWKKEMMTRYQTLLTKALSEYL